MLYYLLFISLLSISCNQVLQQKNATKQTDTLNIIDTTLKVDKVESVKSEARFEYQIAPFEVEKYYSKKIDTSNFI